MDLPLQKMILTDIGKFSALIFPNCGNQINLTKKNVLKGKRLIFQKIYFRFRRKTNFSVKLHKVGIAYDPELCV